MAKQIKYWAPLWLLITGTTQANTNTSHENWGKHSKTYKVLPYQPPLKTTSEKRIVRVGNFVSYQVNVNNQQQNIFGDAANEPSIAVNPNNPKQIAIGWRQFNNVSSDFREAGVAYSNDGGLTWTNNGPIEPGVFRSDPVLGADSNGNFFYQSLAVPNQNTFQVDQWRSADGGQSWQDKTFVYGGDKSWYAIDDTDSDNNGNIYAAWNLAGNAYAPSSFNYSLDNGQSYSFPEQIPNTPIFGTVAVGFDSQVYVTGMYQANNLAFLYLIKSPNPSSALFPNFQQQTELDLGGLIRIGGINPSGLLGQVWVATDKSNRHTRGNVYVAASIAPFGIDPLDVNFTRSRDDAQSFEPFKTINDDDTFVDWQWFGTLGVAPNGRIDVVWLDTRAAPVSFGTKFFSELYYSYSYDGGVTFSKNQAISPSFNHSTGYPVQQKMGDYIDIVSDNLGAHVAYTATFTGGQDVYYIHAQPAAFEENPYFPSHEMDNIWYNPGVPRQGIISKTLVANPSSANPEVINFEAVFTEQPDGTPMWFTLQNKQPVEADRISFPVLLPTGDFTAGAAPTKAIGLATKSRLYDDGGDLIKNRVLYEFDMTDQAIDTVRDLLGDEIEFDLEFYTNSPLYGTQRSIELTPLVAPEQERPLFCAQSNQALISAGEAAEGRLQVGFQTDGSQRLFVGDFTYQKTTDDQGNQNLVLDDDGLAIPTWQISETLPDGLAENGDLTNVVYRPNGGNGFFVTSSNDPGITTLGNEILSANDQGQLSVTRFDGSSEQLSPLAANSFCGLE